MNFKGTDNGRNSGRGRERRQRSAPPPHRLEACGHHRQHSEIGGGGRHLACRGVVVTRMPITAAITFTRSLQR